MKTYTTQNNIGRVKYLVSFHDGIKKHKDGSNFFDIETFRNIKKLKAFVKNLQKEGYKQA